jgi:hypothetical protein
MSKPFALPHHLKHRLLPLPPPPLLLRLRLMWMMTLPRPCLPPEPFQWIQQTARRRRRRRRRKRHPCSLCCLRCRLEAGLKQTEEQHLLLKQYPVMVPLSHPTSFKTAPRRIRRRGNKQPPIATSRDTFCSAQKDLGFNLIFTACQINRNKSKTDRFVGD